MEFAAMKRRDLLELCRQHGLATRGSKADLAAGLAGALSLQVSAAAAGSVVGVVVGKGCLKRLGGSASNGTSGASKKVRFALDETSEVKGQRRRSQVILSQVVAKTRGRRKVRKAIPSASVSGRGRRRKRNGGGGSAHESVTGEVGADALVTHSRMKVLCLHAHSGVETRNNPAEAEEGGEVVGTVTGRKQKRNAQENAKVNANSQAGISRRITRSLSLSCADAPVTQSGTKAVNSCSGGVESQNNLAEAEEEEEAVEAPTYRKQKGKIQESSEDISANAPSGIFHRRVRKSRSSTTHVLFSSAVKMEDVESLSSGFKDRITRSYKDNIAINGGCVSLSDDNGNKATETALGVLDERTKGMHKSVSKEFQNAKAGDVSKQAAVRGCVRRSTRKSGMSVQT